MKKALSVVLAILMTLTMISACATEPSSTDSPETNDTSPDTSDGNISMQDETPVDPDANYAEEIMIIIDNNPIVDFNPHCSSAQTSSAMWAINLIRENAKKFRIDPDKVGICGFSAGGHLAASLSVPNNAAFTVAIG